MCTRGPRRDEGVTVRWTQVSCLLLEVSGNHLNRALCVRPICLPSRVLLYTATYHRRVSVASAPTAKYCPFNNTPPSLDFPYHPITRGTKQIYVTRTIWNASIFILCHNSNGFLEPAPESKPATRCTSSKSMKHVATVLPNRR